MRPGEDDAGGVVWEPTCLGDKMIVALSGIHQLMILLAVLHIAWAANWPPCKSTAMMLAITSVGPFDPC